MAKKSNPSAAAPPRTPRPAAASFTDTARVKELIALMTDNGLTEIELVEDKSRIALRRGFTTGTALPSAAPHPIHHAAPIHPAAAPPPSDTPKPDENTLTIKSPMVGTFYSSPNPDSDPYVSIGTEVEKDKSVVCVIEAMKVFNEIHADATGAVTRILVSNGQTVEYGQPLFIVKPA